MIVTKNWLNEWLDIENISIDELTKSLNRIGLEVDRVVKFLPPHGVVVGKILSTEPHQNGDKLQVCQVDIGNKIIQIVTNDKNLKSNMFVPVATIGTKLKDFVIKESKLRGVKSFGMFCSTEEFNMPRVGSGVTILDDSIGELKLGVSLNSFSIFNDTLIEIELTANRGDCLSIYGVARELSTALNIPLNQNKISQETIKFETCKIEESPDFAFSLSKVQLNKNTPLKIEIRVALLEKNIKDNLDKLLLYSTHSTGVIHKKIISENIDNPKITMKNGCLNFINGNRVISNIGIETFNQENGDIFIESSYINPEFINKNVATNRLKTDSLFYNSSRGSEPNIQLGQDFLKNSLNLNCQNLFAIKKFSPNKIIEITNYEINNFIGMEIEHSKVIRILQHLDFKVDVKNKTLFVEIPKFRHDIANKQDIIEEILRIIGIDNIPSKPLNFTEKNRKSISYIDTIRKMGVANGFFETIHYVFNDSKIIKKYGFPLISEDKALVNPIVETMDTLRPTLLFGLLESVQRNKRNGREKIDLFEIGSVFNENREETQKLAFISSGYSEEPNIFNNGKGVELNFYNFSEKVLNSIGLKVDIIETSSSNQLEHTYQVANIILNNEIIGKIAKLHLKVEQELNIDRTYFAELSLEKLKSPLKIAKEFSKYQISTRDLSVVIDKKQSYLPIKKEIKNLNNSLIKEFYPLDIFTLDDDNHSLTIRFKLQSIEKTLEEQEIISVIDEVLVLLKTKFKAQLR